jgi:hypothetical protein
MHVLIVVRSALQIALSLRLLRHFLLLCNRRSSKRRVVHLQRTYTTDIRRRHRIVHLTSTRHAGTPNKLNGHTQRTPYLHKALQTNSTDIHNGHLTSTRHSKQTQRTYPTDTLPPQGTPALQTNSSCECYEACEFVCPSRAGHSWLVSASPRRACPTPRGWSWPRKRKEKGSNVTRCFIKGRVKWAKRRTSKVSQKANE